MFRPRKLTAIILALLVIGGSILSVCSAAAARSASRHVPTQGHQPSGRCSSKSGSTIDASTSLSKVPERTARARKSFSESEQELAGIPGMGDVRFWGDSVEAYLQAIRPVGAKQNGDWLILSAGGEDGAFGAGLLAGWSKAGTRPDFSVDDLQRDSGRYARRRPQSSWGNAHHRQPKTNPEAHAASSQRPPAA